MPRTDARTDGRTDGHQQFYDSPLGSKDPVGNKNDILIQNSPNNLVNLIQSYNTVDILLNISYFCSNQYTANLEIFIESNFH